GHAGGRGLVVQRRSWVAIVGRSDDTSGGAVGDRSARDTGVGQRSRALCQTGPDHGCRRIQLGGHQFVHHTARGAADKMDGLAGSVPVSGGRNRCRHGRHVVLVSRPSAATRVRSGKPVGLLFPPAEEPERSRRGAQWIFPVYRYGIIFHNLCRLAGAAVRLGTGEHRNGRRHTGADRIRRLRSVKRVYRSTGETPGPPDRILDGEPGTTYPPVPRYISVARHNRSGHLLPNVRVHDRLLHPSPVRTDARCPWYDSDRGHPGHLSLPS
ncbi:uncharacterized protein METZ01_LOCUS428729, partial [marine metagenome]